MRLAPSPRLWMILALALLVALIYWPSAAVYNKEWLNFANITFTHGWLVVVVCLALVLRSRGEIAAAPVEPRPWVLVALGGSILAWLVCYRASIQSLHITVFPAIFWLAVTAALGLPVGRLLAFPVVFFYFAVPSVALLGSRGVVNFSGGITGLPSPTPGGSPSPIVTPTAPVTGPTTLTIYRT